MTLGVCLGSSLVTAASHLHASPLQRKVEFKKVRTSELKPLCDPRPSLTLPREKGLGARVGDYVIYEEDERYYPGRVMETEGDKLVVHDHGTSPQLKSITPLWVHSGDASTKMQRIAPRSQSYSAQTTTVDPDTIVFVSHASDKGTPKAEYFDYLQVLHIREDKQPDS